MQPDQQSDDETRIISDAQAYYWTRAWQEAERESREELAAGMGLTFSSVEEAIRSLFSAND